MGPLSLDGTNTIDPFPERGKIADTYDRRRSRRRMDISLQRAVLLVLGGLVPAVVFIADRAEFVVVVTLVNVLLIWGSLRVATGGAIPGIAGAGSSDGPRTEDR
jgi:hypothetical protein